MNRTSTILTQLGEVIEARKTDAAERPYTKKLLTAGVTKIGAKITEEAAEVVEAAGEEGEEGRQHLIREAGDLIYHLLVMLSCRDATLAEVEAELAGRFGISGIDEKEGRGSRE